MRKYSTPADRYPYNGEEFTKNLLAALKLHKVDVETTEIGDHYDPQSRTVRLTADKMESNSLTAIVVAAHEVGHAHQHSSNYLPFRLRTILVKTMGPAQRFGALILMAAPIVTLITRLPGPGIIMLIGGFLTMGMSTLVHLVTLPTEWNASFNRALPMLESGEILKEGDDVFAREILTAAALTYVAGSLMSLINIARWWTILRKGPL